MKANALHGVVLGMMWIVVALVMGGEATNQSSTSNIPTVPAGVQTTVSNSANAKVPGQPYSAYDSYTMRPAVYRYPAPSYYATRYPQPNLGTSTTSRNTSSGLKVATAKTTEPKPDQSSEQANGSAQQLESALQAWKQAQQKLSAWEATELTPDQVREIKEIRQQRERERQVHAQEKAQWLREKAELIEWFTRRDEFESDLVMPEGLKGKVEIVDHRWNFVVINVGSNHGAIEYGVLFVHRAGKYVAKVRLSQVEPNRSIANILPAFKQDEVKAGDEVFY